MVSGVYDIMSHIMESYFSGTDDNTTDYISEGLMRSLIHSSKIAVVNQEDYESRSNIMWTATWALNYLLSCGKPGDWEVHMIGQAISGVTDATHGMTLSAVQMPYFRIIMPYAMDKFVRFAKNVWGLNPADYKSDEELALAGVEALASFIKEAGLPTTLRDIGFSEEDKKRLPEIAESCFISQGAYRKITHQEILKIYEECW